MIDNRGRLVLRAVIIVAALALIGLWWQNPEQAFDKGLNNLYQALQLFFGEGDWTLDQELNVFLEIARFAAPVVAVASLLFLFTEGLWTYVVNLQILRFKDHLIVAGLTKESITLIEDSVSRGVSVVVITANAPAELLARVRALRIPLIQNSPLAANTLRRARPHRAAMLASFLGNDDDNVELALQVQNVLGETEPNNTLKILIQITNAQLAEGLQDYPKFFDIPKNLEVHFYNVDELAARSLFRDFEPDLFADALNSPVVHIVILGFSGLGQQVLTSALRRGHFGNSRQLTITVLSPDAERDADMFHRQCPAIGIAANVRFEQLEINPGGLRSSAPSLVLDTATMFVCCLEQDTENLSIALTLRNMSLQRAIPIAPIMVSLRNSEGLSRLVESQIGEPEIPDGLLPFGTIAQIMQMDALFSTETDSLAIAIHNDYLNSLAERNLSVASHREWGQLPENFRSYNRAQADHINIKLRSIGCRLQSNGPALQLSEMQLRKLAKMEKTRWNAERASLGWEHSEHRSDLAKQHPLLKPWEECTDAEQANELRSINKLPKLLSDGLALRIAPTIFVGVTGHRAHRIDTNLDVLSGQVRNQLQAIKEHYSDCHFVVMSALADGSDRLIAQIAMQELDAQLYAVLPLPYEIYRRSFSGTELKTEAGSNAEFQSLVGVATAYFDMPLRFAGVGELDRADEVGEAARSKQYALAGAYIVSRCHELIAIWDGEPARGEGGTADVVGWWQTGSVPGPYRFEDYYFEQRERAPARIIELNN
ncbi:MAG: NAD-binding protein [Pseudomonadota bacterium]